MADRALSTLCCSITPFTANGALDVPALRAHFAHQAAAGVGVYVAGPSPGEGYALSLAEGKIRFESRLPLRPFARLGEALRPKKSPDAP